MIWIGDDVEHDLRRNVQLVVRFENVSPTAEGEDDWATVRIDRLRHRAIARTARVPRNPHFRPRP
jgi:hypothetical protein